MEILKSRLGQMFFATHFALAACAIALHRAAHPPPVSFSDEPLLLQALYVINFPTIFVTA